MSSKNTIKVEQGSFFLNNKPFFIYAGEVHYFRTPFNKWAVMLDRAKEAGLNTVSTYIPWRWHEYKEGSFDFTGKTKKERNLLHFLKLAHKKGLYVIARPGPVCHGEIKDDGLPGWLARNYPETGLIKPDGSRFSGSMISLHNKTYQQLVKKWYKKVMPVISSWQLKKGKNIIMVQLGNEISMINWLTKIPDNTQVGRSLYRNFIKGRYKSTGRLNKAYGLRLKSFDDLEYPAVDVDAQPHQMYWDWAEFWRHYYAGYYKFLYREFLKYKIKLPVSANIAHFADIDVRGRGVQSPLTTSMFSKFKGAGQKIVFGGAYQMRRLDYENFHDVAATTGVVRMIADKDTPQICAELQSGVMFDKPELYPSDVELDIATSIASGINGINCYMFSSGQNTPDMGFLATPHSWQAAVDIKGKPREHYGVIARWGKLLETFGSALESSRPEPDVYVGLYQPYYMSEYLKGGFSLSLENRRDRFFFDGLLRLLSLNNYAYKLVNIAADRLKKDKPLIVFSLDFMDKKTQQKLLKYVKVGGKLILGPDLPDADLGGRICTCLQQELGLRYEGCKDNYIKQSGRLLYAEKPLKKISGASRMLLTTEKKNCLCGIKQAGRGKVLAYSFGLVHLFDYHLELLKDMLDALGIQPKLKTNNSKTAVFLRSGRQGNFLIAVNYHQVEKDISLTCKLGNGSMLKIPSKGTYRLKPRSFKLIPFDYKLSAGLKLIKTTAQVIAIEEMKGGLRLELEARPGTLEEIEFKASKRMKVIIGRNEALMLAANRAKNIKFKPDSQRLECCLEYV